MEGATEVTPYQMWSFISEIVNQEPVRSYYLSEFAEPSSSYADIPNARLQVVIVTDKLLYDFIFSPDTARYDISPANLISRIEERRQFETSVEGPPREKVVGVVEFGDTSAILHLVAYADKGRELSRFIEQLRRVAFGE